MLVYSSWSLGTRGPYGTLTLVKIANKNLAEPFY